MRHKILRDGFGSLHPPITLIVDLHFQSMFTSNHSHLNNLSNPNVKRVVSNPKAKRVGSTKPSKRLVDLLPGHSFSRVKLVSSTTKISSIIM